MSRYTWLLPLFLIVLLIGTNFSKAQSSQSDILVSGVPHNSVTSVECDKQDNCWFATWGGIGVYSAKDNAWATFTPEDSGLAHDYCNDVFAEGNGRVWVAHHAGTGASLLETNGTLYDKSDDRWTYFTEEDGLPKGYAWTTAVAVDSKGRIWFGHSLGASRLDIKGTPSDKSDDEWAHYSNDFLKIGPGFVNVILEDSQGCIWFGGDDGLSRMCGTSVFVPEVKTVPNCPACCWSVQWMGWVWDLAEDQDGHIWVADGTCGAAEWNGASWSFCDVGDPGCGLPQIAPAKEPGIRSVAVDTGNNIWFGTRGRGAARLNGFDDWTLYTSTDDGWLGSNEIEGIDFNSLNQGWFAASGGAYLYGDEASSSNEVTPGGGGEVTSPDGRAKANFPPGSVSEPTSVKFGLAESYPSSKAYVVYAFDLSATPPVSFIKPYTLTVLYSDNSLYPFSEGDFGLYWWDGGQPAL
jgi:ligand-binding sensor domain-containing protein